MRPWITQSSTACSKLYIKEITFYEFFCILFYLFRKIFLKLTYAVGCVQGPAVYVVLYGDRSNYRCTFGFSGVSWRGVIKDILHLYACAHMYEIPLSNNPRGGLPRSWRACVFSLFRFRLDISAQSLQQYASLPAE